MGTQTYYASRLMDVSLRCVLGHKWTGVPNALPESAGITTPQMIAFFMTWLLQFPFAWLQSIAQTAVDIYNCGFVLSFTGAAVTYYLLCLVWPVQIYPSGRHELDSKARENMVPTEGFFLDDEPLPQYMQEKMLMGEEPFTVTADVDEHFRDKDLPYRVPSTE